MGQLQSLIQVHGGGPVSHWRARYVVCQALGLVLRGQGLQGGEWV